MMEHLQNLGWGLILLATMFLGGTFIWIILCALAYTVRHGYWNPFYIMVTVILLVCAYFMGRDFRKNY